MNRHDGPEDARDGPCRTGGCRDFRPVSSSFPSFFLLSSFISFFSLLPVFGQGQGVATQHRHGRKCPFAGGGLESASGRRLEWPLGGPYAFSLSPPLSPLFSGSVYPGTSSSGWKRTGQNRLNKSHSRGPTVGIFLFPSSFFPADDAANRIYYEPRCKARGNFGPPVSALFPFSFFFFSSPLGPSPKHQGKQKGVEFEATPAILPSFPFLPFFSSLSLFTVRLATAAASPSFRCP